MSCERCHQDQKENHQCYGGAAKLYSKVKELRQKNPEQTLLLNAGDLYQGTIWYTILKYQPVVELANMLNYTAISLGNHDFDDGIEGLIPFLKGVNFPVLAANMDVSQVSKNNRTLIHYLNSHVCRSKCVFLNLNSVTLQLFITFIAPSSLSAHHSVR